MTETYKDTITMATSLPTYTGDFTSLVAAHPVPTVDALIVGSKWGTAPAGNGVELSFSFPAQPQRARQLRRG
jgi:hypothetical protein